ncbi:MAG TPA: biopolymer transporter ExbD [Candidatus Methylomirabilis sp.]|nr:biopolymer transporter ExbD [Candidatus Methylomirabilis sp.]
MQDSPLEKRAQRRQRNKTLVDLNLVSLIDIFTILIFFLLANASDVEVLPNTKAVKLPESTAEKTPRETVVVVVSDEDIIVQGRKVASVADVLNSGREVIEPLQAELEYQSGRAVIDKNAKDKANKDITIMGDKEIPYKLLRKVMVTCAHANYSNIAFAVLKKEKG